ncbi:MAG: ABC transporter ATP-binding protein [Candidatus Thalassarchaeaceae archaeon]|jgi:ATP-binding cassette subfamily B protein|nr:ABC transporter ATP-binding protein [Candidatus Thalassarchaeaceae archaeon]
MTRAQAARSISSDATSAADSDKQILGRKIWRIVPYIRPYRKRALVGISSNMLARVFDLIPFIFIGFAVDYYGDSETEGSLGVLRDFLDENLLNLITTNQSISYGFLIFLGFAGLAIFQGISEYSWQTLGYKVQHDLRMDATRSLIGMEASYYDLRQTGVLMSILSSDVNQLEDVISDSSTSIIRIITTFVTAFFILMMMSWKLTLVLFGPLALIFPMVYFFSTRVQRKYRKQRESTGDINAVLENVISGISVVQAYNAQNWETNRVGNESAEYRNQAIGASKDRNRFIPGLYSVAGIAYGLLVSVGGWLMKEGEISTGGFVTFLLIMTRMSMPLFIFGMLVNQLQRGEAAARRVFDMVDLEPSIVDQDDSTPLDGPITSIEFRDVVFTYPGTKTAVLNQISFNVIQGKFLGVMGHTGAGKSTILKLILRYYEPDSGQILINNRDIQSITLDSVREQLGFVNQDPFLFYGSVRDNVVYSRESSDSEVQAALHLAGADEFVYEMENGVDTMVGDRGVMLSGGQRARISLARALLKKPSFLILDEASSALDAETERRIQENLMGTGSARTTIAVAHRLSTIRNADEVLAMVDGAIVERGVHDELLANNGVYASQWAIQTGSLNREA